VFEYQMTTTFDFFCDMLLKVHTGDHMNRYQLKRAAIAAIGGAVLAVSAQGAAAQTQSSEVVGYYPGWKSATYPVTAANVDAGKLTMALYAFLDVCWDGKHGNPDPSVNDEAPCQDAAGDAQSANGALVFRDAAADGANLHKLVALTREHPGFKVVVSVGGWDWSNRFSDLAASPQARAGFVASSVKLVRRFGLDGVDIDWEFPGEVGVPCWPGRICARPADKANFVLLARELRAAFDAAGQHDGKHYVITIASGAGAGYVKDDEPAAESERGGAWLRALAPSLDWINVMTYDFHLVSEPRSGHLAALRADPADPDTAQGRTVQASVERYLAAGIAREQLVIGVPFYGYGWKGCAPGPHGDGQYQPCAGGATGGGMGGVVGGHAYGFSHLLAQGTLTPAYEGGKGYRRYWNVQAQAPYLYNAQDRTWISYEDPQSIKVKTDYIKSQRLRGAMFWELSADGGHQLLHTLSAEMRK
jgi:chitinase